MPTETQVDLDNGTQSAIQIVEEVLRVLSAYSMPQVHCNICVPVISTIRHDMYFLDKINFKLPCECSICSSTLHQMLDKLDMSLNMK